MTDTVLMPGDNIPSLALPGADGALQDLFHQSLAGRYRLLLLGPSGDAATISRAAKKAASLNASVFTVTKTAPDGRTSPVDQPKRLYDPEGRLFAGFSMPGGGVVTISPRGRIAFMQAGEGALNAALAALPGVVAPAPIRRAGAPVLLVPDIIEPELRAVMIDHWRQGRKSRNQVASNAGAADTRPIADIKRRTDVLLDDRRLYDAFRLRLERRVLPEIWRAFRFQTASFEAPRLGCYAAADAGAFGAHRDNRTRFTAHRRFAMSLNLNTGAYEGGSLRFGEFGDERYEPPAGGAAIFCCDLLHEAMPVTKGERFAIFTFLTDAAGLQRERELIAERKAMGDSGMELQ